MSEPIELQAARQARDPAGERRWRTVLTAATVAWLLTLAATPSGRAQRASATPRILVIVDDAGERHFTAAELLARPDAADVSVTEDVYHHAVAYRAVPLLALVGGKPDDRFDTVEAQAADGFVSQIPLALIAAGARGGAVAYIAVEDPAHPWPSLPGKRETAGPFYLIWEHPEKSGIVTEQWPYQVVRLAMVESPVHRWPQLAAPAGVDAAAGRGQGVFITLCLPCHRLNGGGGSDTGPDLGRPMNPTQYFSEAGLRAIIRNPKAVRTWPNQQMTGFGVRTLPDADLDALVVYLRAMAASNR